MTKRVFKSYLNKLVAGEYDANDLFSIYMLVCPKSYKDMSSCENSIRFYQFTAMFSEMKYGLSYMFDGKVEYVDTNDLNMLIVK